MSGGFGVSGGSLQLSTYEMIRTCPLSERHLVSWFKVPWNRCVSHESKLSFILGTSSCIQHKPNLMLRQRLHVVHILLVFLSLSLRD